MTRATPKTLEYSTIKRSRKGVVMIVVLVLGSLGLAMLGRTLSGRLYTKFDRYSDQRKHRIALDRDIESIRNGTIKFDLYDENVQLPLLSPSSKNYERYISSGWSSLRGGIPKPSDYWWTSPGDADAIWDTTTACLAKLDAGNGPRYVGVDVAWDTWTTPANSLTAMIGVVTEPSLIHASEMVHNVFYPMITFHKTLSVLPGTATHSDRATFKIIADGQEKTFVVILKKDDTIEFAELKP